MARLPDVTQEQRPTGQPARGIARFGVDTSQAVGAAQDLQVAGATLKAGGRQLENIEEGKRKELLAAEERIRTKQEAVFRARAKGQFSVYAADELRNREAEDDFTKPESVKAYADLLGDKIEEISATHSGSPESYLSLREGLESSKFEFISLAASKSSAAQDQLLGAAAGDIVSRYTRMAYDNPGSIGSIIKKGQNELSDLKPGLDDNKERMFRDALISGAVKGAYQSYLVGNDFDSAQKVLSLPGVDEVMSSEDHIQLRGNLDMARRKAFEASISGEQAGIHALEKVHTIMTRDDPRFRHLSPEQRARIADIQSPANEIRNSALEYLSANADAFANNVLSYEDEKRFLSSATAYRTPFVTQDPITKRDVLNYPKFPPHVANALRARNYNVTEDMVDPLFNPAGPPKNFTDPSVSPQNPLGMDSLPPGKTVWEMSNFVTGVLPNLVRGARKLPIIGHLVPEGQYRAAMTEINQLTNNLVTSLQNNPRFAEGEREAILEAIGSHLKGGVIDTVDNYLDALIGIDATLANEMFMADQERRNPQLGPEVNTWSERKYNALSVFRQKLGVPPRMPRANEDQQKRWYMKQPDGSFWIDEDNKLKIIDHEWFRSQILGEGGEDKEAPASPSRRSRAGGTQ